MSLTVASHIASAALRTSSAAAATVSSNIANADTDGYTRKTANQTTVDTAVGYSSVGISSVTSAADALLLKSVVKAQSAVGESTVTDDYLDRLQTSLGTISSDTDTDASASSGITDELNDLADAVATLATTPDSDGNKATVVTNLETLASGIRQASDDIQSLRADADKEISTTIDTINENLQKISDLNDAIVSGKASGQDVGDLEDQRAEVLKSLSEDIDIQYQVDSSGAVRVSTSTGTALVDGSVHTLSHTAASSVSADTTYSSTSSSGFDGITVNGKDITSSITSGTLKGLIDLRDTTLPEYQDVVDNLATTLKDTLNDISNEGTATPPPSSLTGTTTVSASDAFSGTGTVRIAALNSDGTAVEALDLDLSNYSTVQEVVDAINTMSNVTASIGSDGKLTIAATGSASGVGIGGDDDSVGSNGKGFSAYFGLNDILTGTGADDLAVSTVVSSDSSRLPASKLDTDSTVTTGTTLLTVSEGSVAQSMSDAFTDSVSFAAAGGMSARSVTFSQYVGDFIQDVATDSSTASTSLDNAETYAQGLEDTFSSQAGVNLDEETAALSDLQSAYEAAAAVIKAVQDMFDAAVAMLD